MWALSDGWFDDDVYGTADAELESMAELATIQHQILEGQDPDARGSNDPPGCSAGNAEEETSDTSDTSESSDAEPESALEILKSENIPL